MQWPATGMILSLAGYGQLHFWQAQSRSVFTVILPARFGLSFWSLPFTRFFAITFVVIYYGIVQSAELQVLNKVFYVWVSVFSLFNISVFWSLMAEIFHDTQAKRLFGFIGAGASVGAILGPFMAVLLTTIATVDMLLLWATAFLLVAMPIIFSIQNNRSAGKFELHPENPDDYTGLIGGHPLAGFKKFVQSPYLLGIALFIFFYTSISSFIYFELKNLLVDYEITERARIWAIIDLSVNILTISIAIFATGRIARYLGLPFTLACIPVLVCLGLLLLAAWPSIAVVVTLQIIRRAGNFAISRPAREMLFTVVSREKRFKAKPVIDIVIYRGGDMLNAWAFTFLTQGLGLGLSAVAIVGAGIAAVWAVLGYFLGIRFNTLQLTYSERLSHVNQKN